MPSSITSTLSNHSAIETRTLVCDACACLATFASASEHKRRLPPFPGEAPVGKRPREGGTSPLGELTQPLREPALGEKCRMNASRQLTELDARSRDLERELGSIRAASSATRSSGGPRRPEDPPRGAALLIRRRHDPAPRRLYLGDTLAHLRLQARVRDC